MKPLVVPYPRGHGRLGRAGRAKLGSRGFTLLEVLVASVLLASVFVAVMSVMSGSLRTLDRMGPHERALVYAREKMTEQLLRPQLAPERSSGQWSDGYRWRVEIAPLDAAAPAAGSAPSLFRVRVEIAWGEGQRAASYRLETTQLAQRAPENR